MGSQGDQGYQGDLGYQGDIGNQGYQGNDGTPGGTSSQVQYNNSGSFGGAEAVTYTGSSPLLTITQLSASDVTLLTKGTTSQSGDFYQAQNDSSTVVNRIFSTGNTGIGSGATNRSVSMNAQASGDISTAGDAQSRTGVLRCQTTNNTQTTMTLNGSAASTTNQVILPNDCTCTFTVMIAARNVNTNDDSAGWKIEGVIDRNATAATTALVGSVIITTIGSDSSWTVDAVADTTNGGLSVRVTGENSKTINWVAFVTTVEVVG
jgi:hypothetical protein